MNTEQTQPLSLPWSMNQAECICARLFLRVTTCSYSYFLYLSWRKIKIIYAFAYMWQYWLSTLLSQINSFHSLT
jgi:hypothetical protein